MLKTLTTVVSLARSGASTRNLRILFQFLAALFGMIAVYSIVFHVLMLHEGQDHSWLTGVYWTLTVMSTLGFGDITFHGDAGRAFSILVLLSGMLFLLVLFPFTFIEFFYQPWMEAQAAQRAPRELPAETRGHVILTHHDAVSAALVERLEQFGYTYALLVADVDEALRLHDAGIRVVVGEVDDPEAYRRLRVDQAALVAATGPDTINANVALTVRGLCEQVPIITTASDAASLDVLELAGSTHTLRLEETLGRSFSRRVVGTDALAHVLGSFDELVIAEATARRTPLVGKTIREARLRENLGVTVVGVWEHGEFRPALPETPIQENTVLVLAGSEAQIDRYSEIYLIYNVSVAPVVILGGGRVGRATARALAERETDYRIVEQLADRIRDRERTIHGNAAELEILKRAGIDETATVVITTHDDHMNVYLTIYCRKLRPDVQIISRASVDRNVKTLHRAGADIVMSYASMGASAMLNLLNRGSMLMLTEGLDLFRVTMPQALAGKTLAEVALRSRTGCGVVAIRPEGGRMQLVPDPHQPLPPAAEMILIGDREAEERFREVYGAEPIESLGIEAVPAPPRPTADETL
jgi:voltage-gated potassium channel